MKEYKADIQLKAGGIVPVMVKARTRGEAKKLIEAQYAGAIKNFVRGPNDVK